MMTQWIDCLAPQLAQIRADTDMPISEDTLARVEEFLRVCYRPGVPPPHLAPMDCGSVIAEWHHNGADLEIEFNAERGSIFGEWGPPDAECAFTTPAALSPLIAIFVRAPRDA